jgi:excisionase family DNA binding protein
LEQKVYLQFIRPENIFLHGYIKMLYFQTKRRRAVAAGVPMTTEEIPNVLKSRDLAVLLDLSPDVVNDMARRGHVKGFKSGNQWRFRRRDVLRFIDRMKKLAPPG